MTRHLRVHEVVEDRAELDELEAFAREPARTIDECLEWLQKRDYTLSRGAVYNWKRKFDATDKFRASNEVARTIMDAAKQEGREGGVAISDAANLQLGQLVFEQLLKLQGDKQVSTKELWGASMALKNVVQSQRHVEKLREEVRDQQRKALEAAEQTAKAGGDANAVVRQVRELLGIKEVA